jgi:hypothetical protein
MLIRKKSKSASPPMKKWSPALDFSLKATISPDKITDYSGPCKHRQICKQVSDDAIANGMNVSDSMVDHIIRRFFYRITAHMRMGNTIIVDGLGKIGMSPEEKKKRIKKYEIDYYAKMDLLTKIYRRREFNKNVKKKFKRFNEKRVSLGQKEWTFKEWSKVFKIYKMPRYYRKGGWAKSREKVRKMKLKKQ